MAFTSSLDTLCVSLSGAQHISVWLTRSAGWLSRGSRAIRHRALRWQIGWGAALLALFIAGSVQAQKAPVFTPSEPAFPKLFPKYTGMNGYEDLVIASDLVGASEAVSIADQEGATLKQMRTALEEPNIERALAMVHTALDKPIQSPRDPDKVDEQTLLPEYSGFRRLARVLAIQEYAALADGRLPKAIEVMRDGLRLGYVVQSETLLSGLVGVSIDAISLEELARHFDQLALRDCAQLMAVAEEWLELPSATVTVLTMEQRSIHHSMDGWRTDPARLLAIVKLVQPKGQPTSDSDLAAVELSEYVHSNDAGILAMLDQAKALYDATHRALLDEIKKPIWQRKPLPRFEKRATMAHRLYDLISPAYNVAMERFDVERARIHLLGAHAAVRRFRWENNRLPTSLAELKRPNLTTDPFTGEPLVYKPNGSSYELFSVGAPARTVDGSGTSTGGGHVYLPRLPQPAQQ